MIHSSSLGVDFLVTTDIACIPSGVNVVMVDGTVPGWGTSSWHYLGRHYHFDHHRPGGADIQLDEITPDVMPNFEQVDLNNPIVFVTTQVDADACAAAAWILLHNQPRPMESDAAEKLRAIAYDCDHLGLPADSQWDHLRSFAANAVAALKESGTAIAQSLNLPPNRKDWSEEDKVTYASVAFGQGTEWLVSAALGDLPYPGENGEAAEYFARMEAQRPRVYANCYIYKGVATFDQRELDEYVDPRLLVEWARENQSRTPVTLTIRDGSRLPNAHLVTASGIQVYSYTLGSVPLHICGSPQFSDRRVWEALSILETNLRMNESLPLPETTWGGRNAVGGSGWRDPVISSPHQVINLLEALGVI